ncbi:hypothetical protein AOLI_G00124860 [Acnodon oligacanthus]
MIRSRSCSAAAQINPAALALNATREHLTNTVQNQSRVSSPAVQLPLRQILREAVSAGADSETPAVGSSEGSSALRDERQPPPTRRFTGAEYRRCCWVMISCG